MELRDSIMTTISTELPEINTIPTEVKTFSQEHLFSDEFTILHFLKGNFRTWLRLMNVQLKKDDKEY